MPLGHSGAMSPYLNGIRSDTAEVNLGHPSPFGIVVGVLGYHCSQIQSTIPGLLFSLVKHENHLGCLLKLHVSWLLPILIE